MALTLDTIVSKEFSNAAAGGYDRNEVDDFLDEILEEMENREKESDSLKKQIADLKEELANAQSQLAEAKSVKAEVRPAYTDTHSSESFELVMNKARSVYDDIVSEAKAKAEGIIGDANQEAANLRTTAQKQITDLSDRLTSLRRQASDYYEQLAKVIEKQNESMSDLKRLL
ncbi:MAG: DivIVA domain-containing protein [Clostridia bacterium]|nr:DivIVA domain-containing protein [Clostridia bacterium]